MGENCHIGHHVVLKSGTRIGQGVRIGDHTSLGVRPLRARRSARRDLNLNAVLTVGDNGLIGCGAVLYAGCTIAPDVMVADLTTVRENVTVGTNTIVGRGVAIENSCSIGDYCKLETNAYITAYSTLEDHVFIAPGVTTSNDNFAGRTRDRHKFYKGVIVRCGGRIGAGATILPGREIGPDALLAAGSVLTRNIPAGEIWAGVPARFLRRVPASQLLENQ